MAERDLGSTLLMPQTHLYKPDRVCKCHSQFLSTSDNNAIERSFMTCLTSTEIQQTRRTPQHLLCVEVLVSNLVFFYGFPQPFQPNIRTVAHTRL